MIEIGLGFLIFTMIIMLLVVFILITRSWLIPAGQVRLGINRDEEKSLTVDPGDKLLGVLGNNFIFIPSACGGGGTCAQCKCIVREGGGAMLPTEESHFTRRDAQEGWRLSCQTAVKQDMKIRVADEVFGVKRYETTVVSNRNVASFIKELVVALPEGEELDFRAGQRLKIPTRGSTPPPRATVATGPAASHSYTVRRGDCLSSIAARLLGDPYRWPELYALNRGQIAVLHRLDIALARIETGHLRRIDIEAGDREPRLRRGHGQRQAHIAQADDRQFQIVQSVHRRYFP